MKQNQTRTANAIRNLFFGVVNKVIMLVLPFFLLAAIERQLGVEYLGLNNLFTSVIQMLSLAEMGIGSALVYEMYKPVALGENDKVCALLKLYKTIYHGLAVIVLAIGVICLPFLKDIINGSYPKDINIYILFFMYIVNTSLTYGMFAYKKSIFQAYQRYDIVSKIATVTNVILYAGQFAALLIFKNYYAYVVLLPISTIIDNILTYIIVNKMYPMIQESGKISKEKKAEIVERVGALAGHKIGAVVINSLDSIVISAFLGLHAVALYSNYFYIVRALAGMVNIGYNSVLPGIGNSIVVEDKEHNYTLFKNLSFLFAWFVGVGSICMICVYQPFITVWMGENYLLPQMTMILFVVYFYTWQVRIVGLSFKDAAGLWKADFWKPYVGLAINLGFNILFVMWFGISGVLLTTIIVMVAVYFPWETHVLFKQLFCRSSREYVLQMVKYAIVTSATAFIMYKVCALIPLAGIAAFLVKGLICMIGSNIVFLIVYHRTNEFKYALNLFKSKVLKRQ